MKPNPNITIPFPTPADMSAGGTSSPEKSRGIAWAIQKNCSHILTEGKGLHLSHDSLARLVSGIVDDDTHKGDLQTLIFEAIVRDMSDPEGGQPEADNEQELHPSLDVAVGWVNHPPEPTVENLLSPELSQRALDVWKYLGVNMAEYFVSDFLTDLDIGAASVDEKIWSALGLTVADKIDDVRRLWDERRAAASTAQTPSAVEVGGAE